jgi:tetratricopeptide (TPR) repeat protein
MMVERHYDDEALISLLETDRIHADAHLPACVPCTSKLESFRMIADALEERDVWDTRELRTQPPAASIARLRSFADQMSFEDTQAEAILRELLAGPREEWMPRLRRHPEWRTAGVVRKLVDETIKVIMTMPPDALEMTALSTEIADHLDPTTFASDTVMRLRGAAWRDRGYALFYVGRFAESVTATDRAELNFAACMVDEYDRARVSIVRSLSLSAMEDTANARIAARTSGDTFVSHGDLTRLASARLAEAHLLFTVHDYPAAEEILLDLEHRVRFTGDAETHARILGNLGFCSWQLKKIEDALRYHESAAALLDDLGIYTEAVRTRWNVASILAEAGRTDEAHARFDQLKETFDRLGMTSEAALVSLEIAELLLMRDEFGAVENICRTAIRSFEASGVPYTTRALVALAYMQEAARLRKATPVIARHVREYIGRLPQEGELLFAPPPL